MTETYDASLIQVIPKPENLYALIWQMKARPAMYLGSLSISALWHFINGYHHACFVHNLSEHEDPDFSEFHEFVRARTGFSESTSGWCNMILSVNDRDEEKALAHFFQLFDDFAKNKTAVDAASRRSDEP